MLLYLQSAHLETRLPFAISTVIEGGTAKTINSRERGLETLAGATVAELKSLNDELTEIY